MTTLIIGAVVFAASVYTLKRDIQRLEKENDRLRGVIRELRKQVSNMVERPF